MASPSRFRVVLGMTLRRFRRKANDGRLPHWEYAAFVQSMSDARDRVRIGKMLYLKHSGERWADLRTLPDDELHEFYTLTRQTHERQAKEREAQLERLRNRRPPRMV